MSSDSPEPVPSTRGSVAVWILVAALLAGLLRFVRLGHWSLWLDEVFTWGDAHNIAAADNKAGYLLIRWTVEALGGDPTETALRLAPALFGFAAIPLTYWAFHPLSGRTRAATAALVVAVSAWEIQWSQTARFYTMVQALGLLGGGVAIRGFLSARWILSVLGVGIAGLGHLFHLQGAVVAAAIGLAGVLIPPARSAAARRSARRSLLLFALPGALAAPFAWSVFAKYLAQKSIEDPIAGVAHFALTTGSFVTPTLAALALGVVLSAWVRRERVALFAAAVPVIGGAALAGAAGAATISAQYAFAFFPWIALLASWPMGWTKGSSRELRPLWLLVLVVPLLSQSVLYFTVEKGQRARWREAVELVAARRAPSDVVVGAPAPVVEFYLTGGREVDVRHHDVVVQLDRYNPRPYAYLAQEERVVWFVVRNGYNLSMPRRERADFERFLEEECRLVEHFPVLVEARDLSISVWKFDPAR
ncbi:hypothetical protein Poly30_31100 [Planctomycetes bacterium Poly30]|uniref:Glycosyltransferase RgtA/B/C/D-like domain-containing protein n=1 Tax=Saltatorellus ferox TaxID=2528018 RepID=A0A518EU22_9BACT|nr:hypothetical protein Poly30_31100 [Planctomycetes bacterium Poly30]